MSYELLAYSELRSLHTSQFTEVGGADSMNAVMWELEEGVAERKTPRCGSLI
jgi:hypothetical protein